jgi:hypothetical protein
MLLMLMAEEAGADAVLAVVEPFVVDVDLVLLGEPFAWAGAPEPVLVLALDMSKRGAWTVELGAPDETAGALALDMCFPLWLVQLVDLSPHRVAQPLTRMLHRCVTL